MGKKLGILAGGGELPGRLIDVCRQQGRDFYVIAIEDQADPAVIGDSPHCWIRLGAAKKALEVARRESFDEIVMVGPVKRPSIAALRPDMLATKVLAKASASSVMGDDGLLSAIIAQIEEFGFEVVGPDTFLQSDQVGFGSLGALEPDARALADIKRGMTVLNALGPADVGQSVIIRDDIVIAVEAVEGTDATIERSAALLRAGPGGVLVKLPKPGQESRADLPTVGPQTVRRASDAGLRGIALDGAHTLFVDLDETVSLADRLGIFVYSFDPNAWPESD